MTDFDVPLACAAEFDERALAPRVFGDLRGLLVGLPPGLLDKARLAALLGEIESLGGVARARPIEARLAERLASRAVA